MTVLGYGASHGRTLVHAACIYVRDGAIIVRPLCGVKPRHYGLEQRKWVQYRYSPSAQVDPDRVTCEACLRQSAPRYAGAR